MTARNHEQGGIIPKSTTKGRRRIEPTEGRSHPPLILQLPDKTTLFTYEQALNLFDQLVESLGPPVARRRLTAIQEERSADTPGARLKQLRLARNETTEETARVIGRTKSTIGRIETGKTKITLSDLRALLTHYDVTDTETIQWFEENIKNNRVNPVK